METKGMRRLHRYSNRFKITAVKFANLPGILIQDVAGILGINNCGQIVGNFKNPQGTLGFFYNSCNL